MATISFLSGFAVARVVLAMSGGVDSSVAAHLLSSAGHEVIGLFMRHGEQVLPQGERAEAACSTEKPSPLAIVSVAHKQGCCTASDAADARRVADRLGLSFYALDFQEEFARIVDYFVSEYSSGRTPNPCVMCNNWLKFGKLCEYADSIGAEFIATGHYARLVNAAGATEPALCRGLDSGKDQSYVLFGIDRQLLPRLLFPVGSYEKHEIRAMARDIGLRVADKKDSQEICFVPNGDYAAFVDRHEGGLELAGDIVTVEGEVVGQHAGLQHFTIGQRKGLGVALGGGPRYVVRLERDARRVVIGTREQLGRSRFTVDRVNWLSQPAGRLECDVQIRYQSRPAPGSVTILEDGRAAIELTEPRDGIAPGQAAVWYDGDRVLGGGWIE